MSRIGKKPIVIPGGTAVSLSDGLLTVKGPSGEISRSFKSTIDINISDGSVVLTIKKSDNFSNALWGTYASHISNMIAGVNKPFEKKLIIEGIGYRAELKGTKIVMNLGFSHPVEVEIPKTSRVSVEKDSITVSGANKEEVGQFAAGLRAKKKPEPYRGKGIRYENEVIRRKQGKKSA